MLYRYLSVFKVAAVGGSKAMRGTAIALLFFGAVCLIMGIFPMELDDGPAPAYVHAILILTGLGVAYGGFTTFKSAKEYEALSGKYKSFLVAIVCKDLYNIGELANTLNVDYGTALVKVEEMVDVEIFKGAYIDYKAKELIWGDRPVSHVVTVTCSSCGGNTDAIVGKNNKCQYCGSALAV